MGRFIDLTGKRFGKWLVIKRVDNDKFGSACWWCKCACGEERKVFSRSLIHGKSAGCGDCEFADLIGKKFSRWTVVSRTRRRNRTYLLCKCDCGNEREIMAYDLIKGKTKSCGCYAREITSKIKRIEPGLAAKRTVYNHYRVSSRYKDNSFELSFEQFLNLTQQDCHYCGEVLSNFESGNGNGGFKYNGIDRKDNTKGYTIENCVSCCKKCNFIKKDMSYDEFINYIKKVAIQLKLFDIGGLRNESCRIS